MTGVRELHFPDLSIEGFRGIDQLSIPRLGRVTLLAGKNSVGKTTILDAVRVYASRSDYLVLRNLLIGREEMASAVDEEGKLLPEPDWPALFHGRSIAPDSRIKVRSGDDELVIEEHRTSLEEASRIIQLHFDFSLDDHVRILRVAFRGLQWTLPCLIDPDAGGVYIRLDRHRLRRFRLPSDDSLPPALRLELLGPGILTNAELSQFWDAVALTDDEDQATNALKLVLGNNVERVAVIGDNTRSPLSAGRRVVVKLRGFPQPVPLKSLGDGATRLFGVALALANSKNGFLLIDEAENGIHHSIQRGFWRMVFRTALENNVQVLATTHSWDCVGGFAEAAVENDDGEGVLVRLDKRNGILRAVEYLEDDLRIAAEQGIEVR